jgi:hypothetical protein
MINMLNAAAGWDVSVPHELKGSGKTDAGISLKSAFI